MRTILVILAFCLTWYWIHQASQEVIWSNRVQMIQMQEHLSESQAKAIRKEIHEIFLAPSDSPENKVF